MSKHTAIIRFAKIKNLNRGTGYSLKNALNHNNRIEGFENFFPNADPERTCLNQEILPLVEDSYLEAYNNAVNEALESGKMKYVRKDAIRAIESVAVFNKENGTYTEEELLNWSKETVEWMKKNFGENNVKHAVLHLDENKPHLHIMVIPIDEKGRLNGHRYLNSPYDLTKKITSYSTEVCNKFGIERGNERRKLKRKYNNYKTINKYKEATLGKALSNIDDIQPKEEELDELGHIVPEKYIERVKETFENQGLTHLAEENKLRQSLDEQEAIFLRQQEEFFKKYNKKMSKLENVLSFVKEKLENGEDIGDLQKFIKTYDILYRAVKNNDYPDKEEQKSLAVQIDKFIEWQHKIDKDNEKSKEENKKKAADLLNI